MKRLLSIILATAMIIGMTTTVFAAEMSDITIEYPTALKTTEQVKNNYSGDSPADEITYENSSGRVQWLPGTVKSATWNKGVISLLGSPETYAAYKIRVPKAGKYDITVQYRKGSNGTTGDMYILPISDKDNIATVLATATFKIPVNFKGDATDQTTAVFHESKTYPWTADKADEYIVVWKVTGETEGTLRPANLIFNGGTGKAPINAKSTLSKTMLNLASGETATIETSSVTMNDLSVGTANDIDGLTYESSDTKVVTVSGNVITAAGEGTAKVYTKSGDLVIAENEITVIVPEYSGVCAQYPTFTGDGGYASGAFATPADIDYEGSGWRVDWYDYTGTKYQTNPKWNMSAACFQFSKAGEYAAYKINIPAKGYYNVSLSYATNSTGCKADMYIIPGDTKKEDIVSELTPENKYIDGQNFYSESKNNNPEEVKFGYNAAEAGEYIIVWTASKVEGTKVSVWCKNLTFDGCVGEDKNGLLGKITLGKDELVVGESVTVTATLNDAYNGSSVTGAITYSCDSDVLSVDDATVKANKAGNATLYAEVEGYGNKVALDVTVAAANAPVELTENVNFASGAAIEYKIGDREYTSLSANDVESIPVGSEITVKANDDDNFAGWVRGTKDSKNWISDESEYTFTIMSHTYLTPVYTETKETEAEQVVEFWNENKEYLGTSDVADGKAEAPVATLTGHTFSAWHVSEEDILPLENGSVNVSGITDAIIRAVAKHTSVGGFGTKLPNSNASATYWKRGDDIVAYGTSYDFYKWSGDKRITFGTETIENKPLVVIDEASVNGAYMIEYDKGNASEIVEAGIIYGSDDDIVIGSTDGSKAASQRNDNHGQFCAKPNTESAHDYARGYLIYRGTDNKLYVIYTVAVATE